MTETTATERARAILDEVAQLARSLDRQELAAHVEARAGSLTDDQFRVVVAGDYKSGKSSLCNALVGVTVCPVDADASTRVVTVLQHGGRVEAAIISGSLDPTRAVGEPRVTRAEVPLDELRGHIMDTWEVATDDLPWACEIDVPSDWLATGIHLVDMPGAGGLDSVAGAVVTAELATADLVVFVTDASQELTARELERLTSICAAAPDVIVACTKLDLYPEWRRIRDIDVGHLAANRIDAMVLPVSARLWSLGDELDDDSLVQESGIPELRAAIADAMADHTGQAAGATAIALDALDVMHEHVEADLAAVRTAGSPITIAELEDSLARAEALKLDIAEWRRALHDDIAELEHDLRDELTRRRNEILDQAYDRIDETDPAESWEQIEAWVGERRTSLVTEMFEYLGDRAEWIKNDVVTRMTDAESDLGDGAVEEAGEVGVHFSLAAITRRDNEGRGTRALTSTWAVGEPIMAISQLASVSIQGMIVAAVAGLLFFRKTQKSHKERQLSARRQEAKHQLDDHLEEVAEVLLSELRRVKDRLGRALRDEGLRRISEMEQSIRAALLAARRAAESDDGTREQQLAELQDQLDAVADLRDRVRSGLGVQHA